MWLCLDWQMCRTMYAAINRLKIHLTDLIRFSKDAAVRQRRVSLFVCLSVCLCLSVCVCIPCRIWTPVPVSRQPYTTDVDQSLELRRMSAGLRSVSEALSYNSQTTHNLKHMPRACWLSQRRGTQQWCSLVYYSHDDRSTSPFHNPLTPTVAIWVQLQSILCQTGLSHHL